jgi:hypothetical protein
MTELPIIHGDRNIGDTAVLIPASTVGQRGPLKEILRTQGEDEQAQLLTLTIAGPPVYESSFAGDPSESRGPLFAFVEWGIKGARASAELDLPPGGLTMSVVASFLRVSARYDGLVQVNGLQLDPRATGGMDPRPRQRVGAIVGYGAYGPASRLTRTFRLDDIGTAVLDPDGLIPKEGPRVRVPSFARRLVVTGRNVAGGDIGVRCFGADPGRAFDVVGGLSGQGVLTIPLPGDCVSVIVENRSTTEPLRTPGLTFELAV